MIQQNAQNRLILAEEVSVRDKRAKMFNILGQSDQLVSISDEQSEHNIQEPTSLPMEATTKHQIPFDTVEEEKFDPMTGLPVQPPPL